MKKILILFLSIGLLCVPVTAFATQTEPPRQIVEEIPTSSAADTELVFASAQLMVTDCTVSEGGLVAGKEATLYLTVKNQSVTAAAQNCKLTFSEPTGDIQPVGTGTQFVPVIEAEKQYVWELPVRVSAQAADGVHTVHVGVTFKQPDATQDTAEDTLRVNVRQISALEVGSLAVPGEVLSGDMANFTFSVLNTGKSTLYGVAMTVGVDGAGIVGKDAPGTLAAGERATGSVTFSTADFRTGARTGTVTFAAQTADGETVTVSERFSFSIVKEEETAAEPKEDRSQPRVMVKSYTVDGETLAPGENKKVSIVLHNTHLHKNVKNIKLSLSSNGEEILFEGLGTQYVDQIKADKTYTWDVNVSAVHTARSGLHTLTVSAEYEDADGNGYSSSDVLRLPVRQSVLLLWDNLSFPKTSVMGETVQMSLTLQNMGGATLQNVLLTFDMEGFGGTGSVLVGSIPSGETRTASANFNVTAQKAGKVQGTATLQYTDDFGQTHEQIIDLTSDVIEKPPVPTEDEQKKQEEADKGMRLWWVFAVIGLVVGIGGGVGVTAGIFNTKARKRDEERL